MNKTKVKPTEYKGIQFRSRLEARVALFLDECKIPWEYEPEPIENEGQEYNPDFYLPETDDWIEVKGERPGYEQEILKARSFVSFDSPIKKLIIISEIPDPNQKGMPHFPCYYVSAASHEPDYIDRGWYFFFVKNKKVTGHISSAHYILPSIHSWYIEGGFDIKPKSELNLENRPRNRIDQQAQEAWLEWVRENNKAVFSAFAKARKADFTMRRVRT